MFSHLKDFPASVIQGHASAVLTQQLLTPGTSPPYRSGHEPGLFCPCSVNRSQGTRLNPEVQAEEEAAKEGTVGI